MTNKNRSIIWTKYNDDEFKIIVSECNTYTQLHNMVGTSIKGGNNITMKRRISELGILTDHFQRYANKIQTRIHISDILVENSSYNRTFLKKRLIEEKLLFNRCCLCGLESTWNSKPIVLQLDHINGIHNDNRIDNLRILCPNCHSQTHTYAGRANKKVKQPKIIKHPVKIIKQHTMCVCGNVKSKYSVKCIECQHIKRRTQDRPSVDELINDIKQSSYLLVSKKYGVSDNAIRKWVKSYGFNPKTLTPL
jgi:hypothetical protein